MSVVLGKTNWFPNGMLDAWRVYGRRAIEGVKDIKAPAVFE